MSRSAAFSLLRQCSASVSSVPAVARRSAAHGPGRMLVARRVGSRFYATTENSNDEKKQDGANGEEKRIEEESSSGNGDADANASSTSEQNGTAAQSEDPYTECLKRLKSKEDEVVDLTSRLRYLQADFLNLQRNAAREKEQTRDFAITRFAGDLLETVDVLQLALKSVPESALKVSDDIASQSATSSTSTSMSEGESSSSSTSSDSAAMSDSSASTTTTTSTPDSSSAPSPAPSKSASEYLRELHHGVEMTHRLLLQTLFKYGVKPFDPTGDVFDPNRHEALYQAPIPGKKPGTVVACQKTGYTIKDRTLRAAQVGVANEPPTPSS